MEKNNEATTEDATDYNSTNILDVSTNNSEWNYIEDLTDTDEKQYMVERLERIVQDGKDVTNSIQRFLDTRNKLRSEGLQFYKEVRISNHIFTIYKQIGTPKDVNGYYTTFNGLYSIPWKEINRSYMDTWDLEDYLEDNNIIKRCFL